MFAIQITIKTGKIYNYTIGLVVAMGILPISAHSNIASAQEQEQTGTLVMTKEDEIDSFDDLAGMTLDMSNKNIVPDDSGKVEIDVNDAVQQGNMARNMIKGNLSFVIEGFNLKKMKEFTTFPLFSTTFPKK